MRALSGFRTCGLYGPLYILQAGALVLTAHLAYQVDSVMSPTLAMPAGAKTNCDQHGMREAPGTL